jgi:hypothetical protein
MTDIEKEMYNVIFDIDNGVDVSKDAKRLSAASACYEIHRREMIDLLEKILVEDIQVVTSGVGFQVKGISGFAIRNRIKELKGE